MYGGGAEVDPAPGRPLGRQPFTQTNLPVRLWVMHWRLHGRSKHAGRPRYLAAGKDSGGRVVEPVSAVEVRFQRGSPV